MENSTTAEAVRSRSTYIGASDAAGVLGRSRWATPLSVWADKTGQLPREDGRNMEAKSWGQRHEPTIVAWFEEETGKKVVSQQTRYFDPEHPFLGATVDGIIDGEAAGFEAKTADAWKSKEWEGEEIPDEYILQAYHSMMVTRLRTWYIAVLIGGNRAHWKKLEWDDKIIGEIRAREVDFWNEFVIPVVMPTHITRRDTDVLADLFPIAVEGKIISLSDSANQLVESLTALKADAKNLENIIEQQENELKAQLKDAEAGETSLYKIAWQNISSKRFDVKAFEAQYPDLAIKFKPAKISRRFSYKPKKV